MNESLKHHGVLGQKWGVRRYQPYPKGYKGKGEFVGDDGVEYVSNRKIRKINKKSDKYMKKIDKSIKSYEKRIDKREKWLGNEKLQKKRDSYDYLFKNGHVNSGAMLNAYKKIINKTNPGNVIYLNTALDQMKDYKNTYNTLKNKYGAVKLDSIKIDYSDADKFVDNLAKAFNGEKVDLYKGIKDDKNIRNSASNRTYRRTDFLNIK